MLVSLQYLRAAAALSVVLFHFRDTYLAGGGSSSIAALVDWGHAGVPVFFVLAGFIMVWTTRLTARPGQFLWRRFARIYGGYLPIALGFLAFKAATVGVNHWVPQGLNLFGSLALTEPNSERLLIFPAWSLTYELMFYAAFAGAISFGARFFFWSAAFIGVLIYSFGSIFAIVTIGFIPDQVTWPLTSGLNVLFLQGLAAGIVAINGIHLHRSVFILSVVVALAAFCYGFALGEDQRTFYRIMTFGVGSSTLILALLRLEHFDQIPNLPVAKLAGDASFAIYLLHVPVKFVMAWRGYDTWLAYYLGPNGLLLTYLGVVLCLSIAYYRFVERPLNYAARRVFTRAANKRLT